MAFAVPPATRSAATVAWPAWLFGLGLVLLAGWFLGEMGSPALGQEAGSEKGKPVGPPVPEAHDPLLQLDFDRRVVCFMTGLLATEHPLGATILLEIRAGTLRNIQGKIDEAKRIRQTIDPTVDRDLLYGVEDRAKVRGLDENPKEARAYSYLVLRARDFSPDVLAKHARRDITFRKMFEQPSDFRGEIVHYEGRVKLIERFDPPRSLVKEGVKDLYECWVFEDAYNTNPVCVIVTALPPGLEPGKHLRVHVKVDAYFFKLYQYPAGDGKRLAPMLIGNALRLPTDEEAAASAGGDSTSWLTSLIIPLVLGLLGGTIALVIGVALLLRRDSRLTREKLAVSHPPLFVEPTPDDSGAAAPLPPSGNGDRPDGIDGPRREKSQQ